MTKKQMESKMIFIAVLVLLSLVALLPTPTTSQADDTALPLSLPPRVLTGTEQTCPPDALRQTSLAETVQDIGTLLRNSTIICFAAQMQTSPAASCSAISTSCPSGYYWIRSSNGSAVQMYCDMDRVCGCNGDSTGGWARVAYLDTNDTSQQCPGAWRLITTPRRTCGRTTDSGGCDSAIFPSNGIQYNRICGRVIGYQFGSPDYRLSSNIESTYLDGISITHGNSGSRQHIWSFGGTTWPGSCPCSTDVTTPSFVGEDYFCETANDNSEPEWFGMFFADDPIWDGQDCGTSNTCECTFNNPPWFCKQLPQTTTNDIEIRICGEEDRSNEDTPVERIELYVR